MSAPAPEAGRLTVRGGSKRLNESIKRVVFERNHAADPVKHIVSKLTIDSKLNVVKL
jgi:hypothetical protein